MNRIPFFMNKLTFLSAVLLFVLGANIAFSQTSEIKKSKRLIDIDHASEALAPMEAAIKQNPEEANLYYYLGYVQIKNNQLDAAAKSFDAGIALNPKEALNYVGKGHLSMLQNRPADAKVNFDKALEMTKSKKTAVLKAVAEAYLTIDKFAPDAVTLLQKAKTIDPKDAEIEMLLGDAQMLALKGQGGPSVSAYENAAALDTKNGKPHYKIGLIYLRSRNIEAAQAAFEKSVAVDPEFTYAYDELIDIYYQKKEVDKAIQAAEKFQKLSSDPEKNKEKFALIYVMKGDYAKANQTFKEVIAKNPNVRPIIWRFYIKSLQSTKTSPDTLESISVTEQFFIKIKPEDIVPLDYLLFGKLLIAVGRDAEGIAQLEKAIQLDPKSSEAAQVQADLLFKGRKYNEAAIAYKRLISIKSKPSPNDYLNMGRSYSRSSQYLQSDTVYTKLVEQYPTNLQVAVEGARVKANIDSTQELGLAKPLYEKVLELSTPAPDKNKVFIIEAYKYMGSYYALKENNLNKGKEYFEKVLALDPNDKQAQEVLKAIKEGQIQQLQQKKSGR
jgi:tetratricopeptide (TPR) repeat protein